MSVNDLNNKCFQNSRCLKCYGALNPQEIDFHEACAIEIFGAPNSPADLEESFTVISDNAELCDLTMRLASCVAVLTLPHSLVRADNEGGLLYIEKSVDKESMRMIMDEEDLRANGSCEQVADMVGEMSTISKLDVLNFWEQVIFCWVAGCSSMGLSEFSMHEPHRGLYSLTPASEFVASPLTSPLDNEVSLTINRKRKGITRLDIESAMKNSGLKSKIINGIFSRYVSMLPLLCDIIDSSHIDEESKIQYKEFVKERIKRITP